MNPKITRKLIMFLLLSGGMLIVLALLFGREWRDWQSSSSWQRTTTSDFTIQPKNSSVHYRYVVAGQEYEGDRVYFFVLTPFQDDRVLRWLDINHNATELIVHYDPDAPERSVLVRGGLDDPWFWRFPLICGVAGLLILLPLLFFGGLWRWLRQQFAN